jgi:hypothetical protein
MNKEAALALGNEASQRDPRTAPFGYYGGGSFVMDGVRLFLWFESMADLVQFLVDGEPQIFDIEDPDDLKAYRDKVKPMLDELQRDGFSEETRAALNAATKDFMVIDWWGQFDELTKGETAFSRDKLEGYLDLDPDEDEAVALQPDDMDGFIEYLQTCGC